MYRLLIVDDEAVITDGLYEVFQKLNLELDLCKAYSGREAVSQMKLNRVDIVLTDIRMPDMNGIELMEVILREWPHCKIIFLSGYDNFDYAYQAMKTGAGIRYILKSEGYDKVIEAVQQAIHQLDDEMRVIDLVKKSQERLNVLETMMQGDYLRHIIRGTRRGDDLNADFKKLNIPLDSEQPFLVVLGVISLPESQDSYVARRETGMAIKFLAQSFFTERLEHLGVLDRYNDVVWLIQSKSVSTHSDLSSDSMIRRLVGMFELIGQACEDSLNVSIAFTITGRSIQWNALPNVYDQLRQLQNVRIGDGTRMVQVVQIEDEKDANGLSYIRSPIENTELLAIHLESGRRKEFMEVFEVIKESVVQGELSSPTLIQEGYYSIASALLFYINRMQLYDRIQTKNLLFFDYHPSLSDAFQFLKDTAETLFAFRKEGEKNRAVQAIDQVCNYIEENLDQDLSLTRLAQVIHFNPSYLSRIFKQEKGINLSEYIEISRVRRAKDLLKKSELKIGEIGLMVGYDAPHSFTRFFKRMTGVTPLEYRDNIREIEMDLI